MAKSKEKAFAFQAFLFSVLMLANISVCFGAGEILFEEDFEAGEIDENVWVPADTWQVIDGVLDIAGGEDGYTVRNDFADFEFSADFIIVAGYNGFVMRAQDHGNLYYHGVGVNDPQIWWHSKTGGVWAPEPKPIENAPIPELDVWYRMKFIVEGSKFTCLMGELGEELNEEDHLVGTWENDLYEEGAIGFRESGGEHSQYDNVLVTTIGYAEAVSPAGHLSTTWGKIRSGYGILL